MSFAFSRRSRWFRLAPWLAAFGAAALLAGCGGGSSQVEVFKPQRVFLFGDENSVIVDNGSADGFKYSINDRSTTTTTGQCNLLPTFGQMLMSVYGVVTQACNPERKTPQAFVVAQVGAQVPDATTGLERQLALVPGGLNSQDMVSVMIGANDVIALYEQVRAGQLTQAAAVDEARRRGALAAGMINRMLATGARAIVVTIPDMALSPYAITQEKTRTGAQALLNVLSYEYNALLRTSIDPTSYDGRNYGLVLADDIVSAMAKVPGVFLGSPANATEAACTTADVKDCTTATLVTAAGSSASSYLWASDRHLAYEAHLRIGQQVQSRAVNNPF